MVTLERIETERLVLEPLPQETARALVKGEIGELNPGFGWPHADTIDGIRMALNGGHPPGWLVFLDGMVIGDCGVHGLPDKRGEIELGFGLAAPYRGRGYGTELAIGLSRWLQAQPGVARVVARVLDGNVASRRVLENAGFTLESVRDGHVRLTLSSPPADE